MILPDKGPAERTAEAERKRAAHAYADWSYLASLEHHCDGTGGCTPDCEGNDAYWGRPPTITPNLARKKRVGGNPFWFVVSAWRNLTRKVEK